MRRFLWTAAMAGILALVSMFGAVPALAAGKEDIQKHAACPYCGMDRETFAHSRMLLEFDDGSSVGTCSLHCAVLDIAVKLDRTPTRIMVADHGTHELIDAETATWVIGGEKPGVMTRRAKWAFKNPEDAEQFIQQFGGERATFDQAIQASFEDMAQDTRMIREKRKMKMK